jgi:(2Fe-2S) ferredoxin
MQKPKHHIFVCGSFRVRGEPKGVCQNKGSASLIQYLENELVDRGLDDVMVSSAGCLKMCDRGPVLMVYPDNYWYGGVDEDVVDEILDALEEDQPAEEYLLVS